MQQFPNFCPFWCYSCMSQVSLNKNLKSLYCRYCRSDSLEEISHLSSNFLMLDENSQSISNLVQSLSTLSNQQNSPPEPNQSLNTSKTTAPKSSESLEGECPVCCDALTSSTHLTLQCSHHYHSACLIKWLQNNKSCPVCRAPII